MDGAAHALCDWWQTGSKTAEVDKTAHEGRDVYLGSGDEGCNELFN